ncbi:hypothetical protein BGZ81_009419 [Podila clonocystis]|nr:hypothetical protein BGZ81_009419 [Podila clonocystis]
MLTRVLLVVAAILIAVSAQGSSDHRNVDSLASCYNVCLHQDNWCAMYGAQPQFTLDCKETHDKCTEICRTEFPGQDADYPINTTPLPLDSLHIRNPNNEAQEQPKEEL